jgi:hypothetical protein
MKRKIIICFILMFFFLFSPPLKNQAQTITPSPQPTLTTNLNNNSFNILVDLLKIMLGAGAGNNLPINQKNPTNPSISAGPLNPSDFPDIQVTPDVNNLVYYPQCDGPYDNYPLPQDGTLCQAGCGPTTVAMISASFIDKSINPKTVVEKYRQMNYYLGTQGSDYNDAEKILKNYGLKIANIFVDNQPKTIDQVINLFGSIIKNYQASGWTFFALANFCDPNPCKDDPKEICSCGHFFWITKIDDNLDTWAYDPYYGRLLSRPYNEKSRYPFPKYRVIFGVKK